MIELRSPIPVETPLGRGWAIIYDGDTTESWWTVILNDTRAFVTLQQSKITACRSYTYGRNVSDEEMRKILEAGALRQKPRRTTLARKNLASNPPKGYGSQGSKAPSSEDTADHEEMTAPERIRPKS